MEQFIDKMADKLGRVGAWCSRNKYLSSLQNAFLAYIPATIAGCIAIMWTNVIMNDKVVNGVPQGLGAIFQPIMALSFLNPAFSAISFCTISCISIGIVLLVAHEIGKANGEKGLFPAIVGFLSFLAVTPTTFAGSELSVTDAAGKALGTVADYVDGNVVASFTGIATNYISANGLFTAMIIGILSAELFSKLRSLDALKIKLPEQVPSGVSRSFEVIIPTFLTFTVFALIGLGVHMASGMYLNDLIYSFLQAPLQAFAGNNLFFVLVLYLCINLFWLIGIHGNNLTTGITQAIFKPLLYANTAAFMAGAAQSEMPSIFSATYFQCFALIGGAGCTLGLMIAVLLVGKREENRAICKVGLVPGCFNICEPIMYGMPVVMNPILGIPFIIIPLITLSVGYVLTLVGFCPHIVLEVPWTTPPILFGFLSTGGNIMGAITQIICLAISIVLYIPFVIINERNQAKMAAEQA